MDVNGKCAIITGSAQGFGKALAVRFLEAGAQVCLSDINTTLGEKTLTELQMTFGKKNVHFIRCDVTKTKELLALYDGCEDYFQTKVEILCNNAGIGIGQGWRKCMDVDIMAVIDGTDLALERMNVNNGGKGGLVVNTASLAGMVHCPRREMFCYFTAKQAVVALTRALGTNLIFSETGVKVQCICPHIADTAIVDDFGGKNEIGEKSYREKLDDMYGLMTVEEVAEGFMRLIGKCGNGEALFISKNTPPIVWPDISTGTLAILVIGAKLLNKVVDVKVVKMYHLLLLYSFLLICILLLLWNLLF